MGKSYEQKLYKTHKQPLTWKYTSLVIKKMQNKTT